MTYWIILVLFVSGDTGAAVVSEPMTKEVCQAISDEVVKRNKETIRAIKCVQRMKDV